MKNIRESLQRCDDSFFAVKLFTEVLIYGIIWLRCKNIKRMRIVT
jgi:hypothetical protein